VRPMIGTNYDLAAMRESLGHELLRLTMLPTMSVPTPHAIEIAWEIAKLQRERIAICAIIVDRRIVASRPMVSFGRWASGNGALDALWRAGRRAVPTAGCQASISFGML
jgi:hypothetical protein